MKATNGMSENNDQVQWWPGKYLKDDEDGEQHSKDNYAVVVLNRPINVPNFAQLWNQASLRCCVDGGMNRILSRQKQSPNEALEPPHLFSGDFDSCEPAAMEYAKACGCTIVQTPDQNETDFTKALRSIAPSLKERSIKATLVICDTSGRLDQIMANVNTLFKSHKILLDVEVMLISSNSLAFLLPPGSHLIHIPRYIVAGKLWCGLVPFCKTQVTTTGLKWNLDGHFMEFGGMVSTSNKYRVDTQVVEVVNDNNLLWIMGTVASDD